MARFNAAKTGPVPVTNLAGGEGFQQDPELELVSILLTSFVKDQYYRTADDTVTRLRELIAALPDKRFAAQAAVYARDEFNMRSISHVAAAEIARSVHGEQWTKRFFKRIVVRPDDMLEILSYYHANVGKKEPNALKKGFAAALSSFDGYALAKYRGDGKSVSLVDIVNLVHPRPTGPLTDLVNGTLKPAETWEKRLSEAGKSDDSEEAKAGAWKEMLKSGKLGYMALVKNLRNIVESGDQESIGLACEQLTDQKRVEKSRVLPFRFQTAMDELQKITGSGNRKVIMALSQATELALGNTPKMPGRTLVVLDCSGSMNGQPKDIGSLFAAILSKANDADTMIFGSVASTVTINPLMPVLAIADELRQKGMGGTDFTTIFHGMNEVYDRIFILSDMQGWGEGGYGALNDVYKQYKARTGADPILYSFDLAGHGTMKFPESKVFCVAGFSEKVFEVIRLLEEDRHALVNKVKQVEL